MTLRAVTRDASRAATFEDTNDGRDWRIAQETTDRSCASPQL